MDCKVVFSCMITMFLLFFILSSPIAVGRPEPASSVQHAKNTPIITQVHLGEGEADQKVELEDSCEGIAEEEECLMRRTLAAHIDYIYTQKTKP
ncbi:hypothetical protein CXB51_035635 [Gossypium anomalum]|uniref:Phytosulfokine n=1 Tax=Gossypium anomalum TaxID=47600 RepID=A0A8J5YJM6_9ROSI|nr:hypothetical protein CXB51_035635 [Gossypium anomalum]